MIITFPFPTKEEMRVKYRQYCKIMICIKLYEIQLQFAKHQARIFVNGMGKIVFHSTRKEIQDLSV